MKPFGKNPQKGTTNFVVQQIPGSHNKTPLERVSKIGGVMRAPRGAKRRVFLSTSAQRTRRHRALPRRRCVWLASELR